MNWLLITLKEKDGEKNDKFEVNLPWFTSDLASEVRFWSIDTENFNKIIIFLNPKSIFWSHWHETSSIYLKRNWKLCDGDEFSFIKIRKKFKFDQFNKKKTLQNFKSLSKICDEQPTVIHTIIFLLSAVIHHLERPFKELERSGSYSVSVHYLYLSKHFFPF